MLTTPHAPDLVYYVLGPAGSVAAHMATRVNPTFQRSHDALRSGGELPVTLADARAAIELCTALYHAARTREPVSLPIAADHPLYGGWQPRARP